jgi:uncharacterized protein YajQ (UPF0234 family)
MASTKTRDDLQTIIDGIEEDLEFDDRPDTVTDGLKRLVTSLFRELEMREKMNPITASARELQGRIDVYLGEHDIKRQHVIVYTPDGEEIAVQFKYAQADPLKSVVKKRFIKILNCRRCSRCCGCRGGAAMEGFQEER